MNLSPGTWTTEQVAGHPCHFYQPARLNEHGYVVVYLHGVHLQTLHEQTAYLEQFDRHGLPVVCPMTARSWWTNRICEEFDPQITAEEHLMKNVLPMIEQRFDCRPPRLALFGTSMGGQGALRLAYKYPDTFPVVAGVSPAIDFQRYLAEGDETLCQMYEDAESARQDTAILHIHPLYWPRHQFFCCCPEDYRWWDSADRLRMKLSSLGVPHETDLETSGPGHGFGYYNQMAEPVVSFLQENLDRERLRVV